MLSGMNKNIVVSQWTLCRLQRLVRNGLFRPLAALRNRVAGEQTLPAQQAHRGGVPRLDVGHRRDIQPERLPSYDYDYAVIRGHMEPIARLLIAASEGHNSPYGERLPWTASCWVNELEGKMVRRGSHS